MAKIDGKYEQFWTENLLSRINNEDSITKRHHLIARYLHQRIEQIDIILANIDNDDIEKLAKVDATRIGNKPIDFKMHFASYEKSRKSLLS